MAVSVLGQRVPAGERWIVDKSFLMYSTHNSFLGCANQKRFALLAQNMDENVFYETEARELIKRIRREKDVPYWRLAENLLELGVEMEEQVLINRVNRGRYSFAFALQLLAALGIESLNVPRPPRAGHRPKTK